MSNSVEINQTHNAKVILFLDELSKTIGDHRDSADYYEKIEKLSNEIVEKLSDIVFEEL